MVKIQRATVDKIVRTGKVYDFDCFEHEAHLPYEILGLLYAIDKACTDIIRKAKCDVADCKGHERAQVQFDCTGHTPMIMLKWPHAFENQELSKSLIEATQALLPAWAQNFEVYTP